MSTTSHPSAHHRLDPLAEAFALRFDPADFHLMNHRNILDLRLATAHSFSRTVRLIGSGTAPTHRATIQIPIAL